MCGCAREMKSTHSKCPFPALQCNTDRLSLSLTLGNWLTCSRNTVKFPFLAASMSFLVRAELTGAFIMFQIRWVEVSEFVCDLCGVVWESCDCPVKSVSCPVKSLCVILFSDTVAFPFLSNPTVSLCHLPMLVWIYTGGCFFNLTCRRVRSVSLSLSLSPPCAISIRDHNPHIHPPIHPPPNTSPDV